MKKVFFIFCSLILSVFSYADDTLPSDFYISSDNNAVPVLRMPFDAGGFSDWWYWGGSSRHDYAGSHEMLSGEWAAAIYYDDIQTDPIDPNDQNSETQAMWLTDWFSYPSWETNSTFSKNGDSDCWFDSWNDANNLPTRANLICNTHSQKRKSLLILD